MKHSRFGILAIIIDVGVMLYILYSCLFVEMGLFSIREVGIVVILGLLVISLILSIVGLIIGKRKRLFCIIGIVLPILVIGYYVYIALTWTIDFTMPYISG